MPSEPEHDSSQLVKVTTHFFKRYFKYFSCELLELLGIAGQDVAAAEVGTSWETDWLDKLHYFDHPGVDLSWVKVVLLKELAQPDSRKTRIRYQIVDKQGNLYKQYPLD